MSGQATPEELSLRARQAALEKWGRTADRSAATAPARAARRAKLAAEIDPDNKLDSAERERRVDYLVKAHMSRMALKASTNRRRAREAAEKAAAAEAELSALGGDPDAVAAS